MGTTQPIRKQSELELLKEYFINRNEIRNYALLVLGLNIPLRISDLLSIHWNDVYDEKNRRFFSHLQIIEKKTGKRNYLVLNSSTLQALQLLQNSLENTLPEHYIFTANNSRNKPLTRVSAYLIIHNAAESIGLQNIGCHSLRKTFGYHAWKNGVHLALIMSIYNHSSIAITKRYLGIEQEDKDNVFLTMNL